MLESRPEDALVKLVETVETAETDHWSVTKSVGAFLVTIYFRERDTFDKLLCSWFHSHNIHTTPPFYP